MNQYEFGGQSHANLFSFNNPNGPIKSTDPPPVNFPIFLPTLPCIPDKVYVLYANWGEYSDYTDIVIGVFSSEELAQAAKKEIEEKADRTIWPWCHILEDNSTFEIYSLILDSIDEHYPLRNEN